MIELFIKDRPNKQDLEEKIMPLLEGQQTKDTLSYLESLDVLDNIAKYLKEEGLNPSTFTLAEYFAKNLKEHPAYEMVRKKWVDYFRNCGGCYESLANYI